MVDVLIFVVNIINFIVSELELFFSIVERIVVEIFNVFFVSIFYNIFIVFKFYCMFFKVIYMECCIVIDKRKRIIKDNFVIKI